MRHWPLALNLCADVVSVSTVLGRSRVRVLIVVAAIVVGGVIIAVRQRAPVGDSDPSSIASATPPRVSPHTAAPSSRDSTYAGSSRPAEPPPPPGVAGAGAGSAARYPVDLEALRAELPRNRYWAEGAPTSDPEVARARAARAEADNARLGRIQANEASPEEIRAYYADRRELSRDYLELAEHVLARRGDALPERDRGMFELSVRLHRDRLRQIERDESDALARLAAGGSGS